MNTTGLQQLKANCTVNGHLVSREKIEREMERLLKVEARQGIPGLLHKLAGRKNCMVEHQEQFVIYHLPRRVNMWRHEEATVDGAVKYLRGLPDSKGVK